MHKKLILIQNKTLDYDYLTVIIPNGGKSTPLVLHKPSMEAHIRQTYKWDALPSLTPANRTKYTELKTQYQQLAPYIQQIDNEKLTHLEEQNKVSTLIEQALSLLKLPVITDNFNQHMDRIIFRANLFNSDSFEETKLFWFLKRNWLRNTTFIGVRSFLLFLKPTVTIIKPRGVITRSKRLNSFIDDSFPPARENNHTEAERIAIVRSTQNQLIAILEDIIKSIQRQSST